MIVKPIQRLVGPVGPKDADIVIVGEAPGQQEEKLGQPFVGPSGRMLDGFLANAGMPRSACYLTNVMQIRPPGNDFGHFYFDPDKRLRPKPELIEGWNRLHGEIQEIRPNVIITLGREALRALTGKQLNITDWRGSVIMTPHGKVVPTYHPAGVMRQYSWFPIAQFDIKKAVKESAYPEVRRKQRDLITSPRMYEVRDFIKEAKTAEAIAFDIETIRHTKTSPWYIDCIGIATSPTKAMCIPFCYTDGRPYWNLDDEVEVWLMINDLLNDHRIKKIGQNGQFDMLILRRFGFRIANYWFDTMNAQHTLYPEMPKGLDFMASIYTDVPFYKDTIRENRWLYNATDAAVTYEVAEEQLKEMRESGLDEFYFDHVHPLIQTYIEVQEGGVLIDEKYRIEAAKKLAEEIDALQAEVDTLVGHPLNVNSPTKMRNWLYKELRLPVKRNRKTSKPTADENALKELSEKYDIQALTKVVELRQRKKLLSTYIGTEEKKPYDSDGRIRCTYILTGTESGRLASRASVDGTGTNLQNVPKGMARRMFVADPGYVFIATDLSQAEARVVAWLAQDERMMEIFNQGGDVHRKNASLIFGIPEDQVDEDQRYLAKRIVHGSNYGMGIRTFAKHCGVSESEARALQNAYFSAFPGIKKWHREVEAELRKTRTLVNPFGRRRVFYGRWDDHLIREAYAQIPQSTVADHIHRASRICYQKLPNEARIALQVHDELVFLCREDLVEEVWNEIIRPAMELPIYIHGKPLVIPAGFKVGHNWDEV